MKNLYIADIRSNTNNGISTGHFIPVAKMYQNIFRDKNKVFVSGGPIYNKYFNSSELLSLPYNISSSSLVNKIKAMKNCIKLFNSAKNHIIILQQSSTVTSFLGILLFYHCKSKLYLIQYSNDCFKSAIGRFIFKLIKNKIDGVICPTDNLGKMFGLPYCVVPDYIYTNQDYVYTKKKEYDKTKYDFCILGRIAPEKGVIECAQKLANTKYQTIIAGKVQDIELKEKLEKICSEANNINLILDYISEEQYHNYLMESKYALLNYTDTYSERSSGVVFDMLFNNVPVVGSSCYTLQFIQEKQLGYIYKSLSSFNPEILMNKSLYDKYIENISNYKKEHKKYLDAIISFVK